jgi:branched-chain amino acid transport system ATP-binding protein
MRLPFAPSRPVAVEPSGDLLVVRDLQVTYGRRTRAVQGVDFRVAAGEIVALLGPNGAGKTSTLRAVSGFLNAEAGRVTSGSVVFAGQRITGLPPHRTARRGVRLVAERDKVFAHLSVEQNLRLTGGREPSGERMEEAFTYFPRLKTLLDRTAGYLSGGERQMLALARAIISDARLLLIDEMSLGLSPAVLEDLLETVRTLNARRGITTLLVEQNAPAALSIAARGYVLDTGRVVAEGQAADLGPRMAELYLGQAGQPGADRAGSVRNA